LNEPKNCPNCGTPTTKVHSHLLSKTGMPDLVERALLRLYEKNKVHIHFVCITCINNHDKNHEMAWIMIQNTLWGWIHNGKQLTWRISKLNKEQVQFT